MAGKKREKHHENKDTQKEQANALSMIQPTVMGTPLGMLPILPIPMADTEDEGKPGKNED